MVHFNMLSLFCLRLSEYKPTHKITSDVCSILKGTLLKRHRRRGCLFIKSLSGRSTLETCLHSGRGDNSIHRHTNPCLHLHYTIEEKAVHCHFHQVSYHKKCHDYLYYHGPKLTFREKRILHGLNGFRINL